MLSYKKSSTFSAKVAPQFCNRGHRSESAKVIESVLITFRYTFDAMHTIFLAGAPPRSTCTEARKTGPLGQITLD